LLTGTTLLEMDYLVIRMRWFYISLQGTLCHSKMMDSVLQKMHRVPLKKKRRLGSWSL